eukprot:Pgem_evm1s932
MKQRKRPDSELSISELELRMVHLTERMSYHEKSKETQAAVTLVAAIIIWPWVVVSVPWYFASKFAAKKMKHKLDLVHEEILARKLQTQKLIETGEYNPFDDYHNENENQYIRTNIKNEKNKVQTGNRFINVYVGTEYAPQSTADHDYQNVTTRKRSNGMKTLATTEKCKIKTTTNKIDEYDNGFLLGQAKTVEYQSVLVISEDDDYADEQREYHIACSEYQDVSSELDDGQREYHIALGPGNPEYQDASPGIDDENQYAETNISADEGDISYTYEQYLQASKCSR